jgi:hypothetical protein
MPEPKLSPAQFAEKLKSKYPQYASIDDATLIDRVLQKYPQYGDIVNVNDAGEEVKKKKFSEASALQSLAEPSASDTSTSFIPKGEAPLDIKVPEAFKTAVSTPKFEPTKSVKTTTTPKQEVTTKDWWADKWNGLIEGVQTFAANVSDENNMNGEAIADFIQDNKTKKPELFASFNENLELLKSKGYDDVSGRGMAANIAYTDSWRKDNKIENEVLPYIRQKGREKSTENFGIQIDEKVQKELGDRFFSSAVRGLATSTPAMLTSASTMGMSFFNMSYNNAEEQLARQLAENPNLEMTRAERETYKVTNAGIEAVLERVGLGNALKGNPMLKRAITGKVLTRLSGVGDDVGAEAFEKIVKQEVKGLAGYARKVAAGSISEFETGALQQLSNDLINQYVTDSQGKNIFSPKTTKEIITDVLYAGAQEAVGGGIISGAVAPFQKSALDMTKQEFESGVDFAKKVDIQKVSEYLNKEVETGKITEDQASQTLDRIQDFNDLSNKLPDDISKQGQYELFQLIAEKQRLQKSVVGKDEVIQQTITEDVNAINQRIKEVYDTQKETGVPSPVVEGEAPIEVQPIQVASGTSPEADRVLQVLDQQEVFQKIAEAQEVDNTEAQAAQQQILNAIDEVDALDIADDIKTAYIQTLEDKFDDIEYYDNKTITTTEQVTEEVPIGAPRAGSRTIIEPEVRSGKFRLFERLNNLEVAVGTETEGQTSVIETQDDGSIDVITYDKNTKQEVSRQPKVAENILGLEYVESILDDNGELTGVVMRPKTPKGEDISPVRIQVVNRPELALDIAIDARKKEIGDAPEVIWMQEYETVTRDVTTKERVQAAKRPERKAARVVLPTETVVAEQVTEQVVEQEPIKNKRGLSSEQVTEAVSGAERLAKRLGLPTKIIAHNSRKEFNDAMDEVSKSGSVASGVESGRFIPSRNEIHLNLEDMTSEVPFHEVFHAAFVNRFGKRGQKIREKVATDFYNGIVRILRSGSEQDQLLADAVESFTKSGYYTAEEKPEEFLAQTAGFLSTSGDKISKSTMDKLIQWLNNFIAKIAPGVKVNTRGEFIDFMNSFSGALFESSTEKSLEEIAEEGSYTPAEPAVMPDLSESASRFDEEKAPSWLKNNIANLKSLAGRKIPFAVFYDNTRVGKSTLRNKVTGKESNRNLMGGFGYSQLEGVKFEDDGAKVSVLAFTNEDMAARKLSEYLRKEGDLIPVAMQNTQTGHLGNLDVLYEMFDDLNGVVSTAPSLYAEQQTGKKKGPEFEAARKDAEDEILGAIKQSVVELSEKTEVKKKPDGTSVTTDRVKAAQKIRPMLDEITTLAEWRDKILLGEWDSFGTRGLFNAYLLQAKPSKITKSTRKTHKVLHGKYGVPTVKEIEDGITEQVFSNAELGDVIKFVSPDKTPVIYTTDPIHKDLPKEGVQKKSDKITYTLKYIGNQVDAHVSYPYILAGKNDGFAPSYIDITEIFPDLRGKVKKSQSFYAAGRRSLTAPVGELDIKESSSRDVREEILDKEQLSFKQRAVNTAKTFVWSDTQKQIRVFKERMSSQLSVEGREIKKFTKGLNQLLKKADVQTIDLVGDIFDGTLTPENQRILESKPNGSLIFGQANAMRNYIDSFSEDFVNSPEFHAMPEETVNTIIDNFGQYMRGSYRFWKDKNFKPSNAARREAIAYEYEVLRAKNIGELVKLSGLTESEADDFFELLHDETLAQATKVIDDYIADIEKIRNGSDFKKLGIVSPSGIKLPSEQFLRRKELPETIQNLLGKERDPIIRFIDTTIALSNIKYKGHMLYAISESLGGTQFIKNEVTDAEKSTGEYKEVKDKFSPLNGRFVHRDVYEAITNQNIYESDNIWMSGYLTTLQLARKSKVIYNLPTWRKNLTGGWYTMAANGVINPSLVRDLKRRAQLFANGETDAETEALIKIMGDNGIIGQDVNANLLGFTNAIYSRTLTGNDNDYTSYVARARNLIKNFDSVVGQKYAAVDDYTKLIVFRSEIQSFAKKMYGKPYDSLTEAQKNKVHAEAAEFVKQNTPTFSRLPKWYASLAKLPAGDFLSFEFESLRSFGTNILNGRKDLMKGMTDKTLTPEQKAEYIKAGSRRLAGSAAIMGARLAITSILASLALGDDDELEEDIKNNRPNWMEGHSIIPTKVSKEGIATVYDYSMEDPYGSFFDLATDPLSFPAYVVDLLQPNMGISFLTNLAENKDFYGRDITNSYDDPLTKGYKYGGHTLKSLIIPPFIASSYRDEQKRLEAEADKYSPLDAVGRVASRAVIRDYEYNIPVQFYYFTDQFRTKKEQYSDLTGASRDNRLAELDEIKKMYKSITNIGIKKGNFKIIVDANKNIKRALKPAEEAYVLYGYEIPEKK